MNIQCGPNSDIRSLDITLPNTPSKLGVLVSGGIDSAILYYLILLENRFSNNMHTVVPLSVMRKEGSRYFAQKVVDKIHELHNLPQVETTLVGDNSLPEEEQVRSAVRQSHNMGFDIVYCGVIEQLPQHMVNWQPISSRETDRFKTPLQVLNKSHIIDLCVKLRRQDLFDVTHSCSRTELGRCNVCNGCNERRWGFEQNNIQEPDYVITIQDQVKFLHNLLDTNLEKGLYITGGALTYIAESDYRKPLWKPNDIDICYSEGDTDTYNKIHALLVSKSKTWETLNTPQGFVNNNYYIPGFIRVSLQATKLKYHARVKWIDYSVCAIVSDKNQIIMHADTQEDIKNKILNRTGLFRISEEGIKKNLERRYKCYTDRGFVDESKKVWEQMQEFLKENNQLDTKTK